MKNLGLWWRDNRALALRVLLLTLALGLCAHGYRYFGLAFSHDSMMIFQRDLEWQMSLGRITQPLYLALRGYLTAPFFLGLLSLLYLAAAVFLVCRLLGFTGGWTVAAVCAVMAVNPTLSLSNASYLPWVDMYMLALLLGTVSVVLWDRYRWGFLLGAVPLAAGMGLYQAYFQAAVALFLLVLIRRLLDGETVKTVFLAGVKALGTLLLSLVGYALALKLVLARAGIALSSTYNGVEGVGDYAGVNLGALVRGAYAAVFQSFARPETLHPNLSAFLNLALLLAGLGALVLVLVRRKPGKGELALLAALLAVFPFGVNVVYFISKGMEHSLMTYSFCFFYVLVLLFLDRAARAGGKLPGAAPCRWAALACVAALLFNNVAFSNRLYLRKALEYDATHQVMGRVLDRVEQTEGYVPGVTRVAIIGSIYTGPLAAERPGFELVRGVGMDVDYATTYYDTYVYYFQQVLGYPVALVSPVENWNYQTRPEAEAMPAFPAQGCCAFSPEGDLLVKLS